MALAPLLVFVSELPVLVFVSELNGTTTLMTVAWSADRRTSWIGIDTIGRMTVFQADKRTLVQARASIALFLHFRVLVITCCICRVFSSVHHGALVVHADSNFHLRLGLQCTLHASQPDMCVVGTPDASKCAASTSDMAS